MNAQCDAKEQNYSCLNISKTYYEQKSSSCNRLRHEASNSNYSCYTYKELKSYVTNAYWAWFEFIYIGHGFKNRTRLYG